jgi:5-methylcytosine-specific restriction endonuclease McrA
MPSKRPQAKWCSDYCRDRGRQDRDREKRNAEARERWRAKRRDDYDASAELWAICWRCGDLFLLTRPDTRCQRPECQRAVKALATRLHVGVKRVRDAGFGAAVEEFTVRDVYERDGGRCYLCGLPTLADLDDGRQATSASLDHVVPIEQGGGHTLDNVRLTHLRCNTVKGRRTPEEARAVLAAREPVSPPEPAAAPAVPLVLLAYATASRLTDAPRQRPGGRPLVAVVPMEPAPQE